ncbi:MAG: NUDIX hydrolase [Burkholderiaceae bacterium]
MPSIQLASDRFGAAPTDTQLTTLGYRRWSVIDGLGRPQSMGWLRPDLVSLLPAEPLPIAAISDLVEALRQTSAADGWRDECFTLCNEAGEPIVDVRHQAVGLERSLFRPLGLFYTTVQLNLVTEQGRAWIGQRALHKAVDPGLWDAAAAGGLTHGEQPQQALRRECWEEAGLSEALLSDLRVLGSVLVQRVLGADGRQGLQREQVMSYGLQAPLDFTPTNQDGEVQAFACVTMNEVWRLWQQGQFNHEAAVGCLDFLMPQPG